MSNTNLSPDALRKIVFDTVSECREGIKSGQYDISRVENSIRAYCESIAKLPLEQGREHKNSLNELIQLVSQLGHELTVERDHVVNEIGKLERLRKANVAYQSSDGMVVIKDESNE